MDSCCKITYNNTFDRKIAASEFQDYLKNGPKKSTRHLLDPLKKQDFRGYSLLDIGGGIGAIVWEMKAQGIDQIYYQEISDSYGQVFQEQVKKKDLEESIHINIGDFVEQHQQFPSVDLVTLDKVICCYEEYKSLVNLSAAKANKFYAYTLPLDVWWVKAIAHTGTFFRTLFGNKLRTYVHPVDQVEKLVVAQGFEKIYHKQNREWLTVIFKK